VRLKSPIIIVGLGELGQLLGAAFLRSGHPVYPITRSITWDNLPPELPDPGLVVIAVGEADLDAVLSGLPERFRDRVLLLQNELLPPDWLLHGIIDPTVVVVWLDKKRGRPAVNVLPNRVAGPASEWVVTALNGIDVPTHRISEEDLVPSLVAKNLYILTINLMGLKVGGTVGDLWTTHRELTKSVADEVLSIQFKRLGYELDRKRLMDDLLEAFAGDLNHICMGRSAPKRFVRALEDASRYEVEVPHLQQIAQLAGLK
jgi:ketopantoate reductase